MRKAKPKKRVILPDPVYGDSLVTRFVNDMMVDGKKSIAFKIFYSAMELVGKKTADTGKTPTEVWKKAMELQMEKGIVVNIFSIREYNFLATS